MKRRLLLMLIMIIPILADAQIQKEYRKVIFNGDTTLNLNESITAPLSLQQNSNEPRKRYLRIVGGGIYPDKFFERGEIRFREMECLIDDCIDSIHMEKGRYALNLYGENDPFERCAFIRVPVERISDKSFELYMRNSADQLVIHEGGKVNIELEVYFHKKGRHPMDIYDTPDTVLQLAVPGGSYADKESTATFTLDDKPATMLLKIAGKKFEGNCRFAEVRIASNGKEVGDYNFLPFRQRNNKENYWVGINMMSRPWPKFKLEFNGKELFKDRIFDRASNVADLYITLPGDIGGSGAMTLTLLSEQYLTHVPFNIKSIELIEESARPLEIISIPEYVKVGAWSGILVETNEPDVEVSLKDSGHYIWEDTEQSLKVPGLHVLRFKALEEGSDISFSIRIHEKDIHLKFNQFLIQTGRPAYLSSGDDVYIDKENKQYDHFFKWYFRNRVGNWMQFRPSYQWSGFRKINEDVLRHYFALLNDMEIPYAWQVEGRTLAGNSINPSMDVLQSDMFRGKQAHENDGGYYYWQHFIDEGLFSDIRARYLPYGGIFAKHRPIYSRGSKYIHYDTQAARDMEDGANIFVENLKSSRGESTRHTGPSTLFRYFFQAGYRWVGAEQMYGPEDVVLAALRGASLAYGAKDYGSLHAVQWGSGPFTDPKHSLRLYQSLALSYMNGSSHINTEEGFWTDEFSNDRYSRAGQEHLYAQHQLLDYAQTHSRNGEISNKIAVLQGWNCPWKCFGRTAMWSQKGKKWEFNQINESFDLLKIFYPESILNGCGPEGWFTTTPYGAVDIVPIEAPENVLGKYHTLIFLGWNTYRQEDFIRLEEYVRKGGTLLLGAVHLNTKLQPDEVPELPHDDPILRKMLGNDYEHLTEKTEIDYGKGRIIYYPQKCYPAQKEIRDDYESCIRRLAQENQKSEFVSGTIIPGEKVNFTCWDSESMRTLMLLNVDWQNPDKSGQAILRYGNSEFKIPVRHYTIETVHCADGLALHPMSNTSEVLSIKRCGKKWIAIIQTTGDDKIEVFNSIDGQCTSLRLYGAGTHQCTIDTRISSEEQAVAELAERVTNGTSKGQFIFSLTKDTEGEQKEFFEISKEGHKVQISGNTQSALTSGFNWYLKYVAHIHISWNNLRQDLPDPLPLPEMPIKKSTDLRNRYYLNYCTHSYSMPFWDWDRWEKEIDWMALHGVNLPLHIVGIDVVWRNVLRELDYPAEDIDSFIAGPAYHAWWLMNNLEGWGGPLPDSWYEDQEKLSRQITHRMNDLGISPVVPGYAGSVPSTMGENLGLDIIGTGKWCEFSRPAFLSTDDPAFTRMSELYYKHLHALFGDIGYFSMDPFHEGGKTDGIDLDQAGKAIMREMKKANPDATWVIQSWQACPHDEMIRNMEKGDLLVLDLYSDKRPQWGAENSEWYRPDGFLHHDWLFCMLLNFGGNTGLHGRMNHMVESFYEATDHEKGKQLKGVGATPEGIENNPMMYELLYELPWREEKFDMDQWLRNYLEARYGKEPEPEVIEAWTILKNTVYNAPVDHSGEGEVESLLCARPGLDLKSTSTWGWAELYYHPELTRKAAALMDNVAGNYQGNRNFGYDLIDLKRQCIADQANGLVQQFSDSYHEKDKEAFKKAADEFLELILLQDKTVSGCEDFSLEKWVKNAEAAGHSPEEKRLYKENALRLITVWGNKEASEEGGLHDYSYREWSGLLKGLYYERWKRFFKNKISELETGNPTAPIDWFQMEEQWIRNYGNKEQ